MLYNLFDWPCHQNAKLVMLTIGNDFKWRETLPSSVYSRMGNECIDFLPYSAKKMVDILPHDERKNDGTNKDLNEKVVNESASITIRLILKKPAWLL